MQLEGVARSSAARRARDRAKPSVSLDAEREATLHERGVHLGELDRVAVGPLNCIDRRRQQADLGLVDGQPGRLDQTEVGLEAIVEAVGEPLRKGSALDGASEAVTGLEATQWRFPRSDRSGTNS